MTTTTVVTGSSTGIGYATALRLARDGHKVYATMRDPSSSDIGDVAKGEGLDLEVHPLDVTSDESVARLFGDVGDVDVLVNNAGIAGGSAVEEAPLDQFREVMETNFFGVVRCTKAVLPSMRERGSGCIVNVSSQAGRLALPRLAPYNASKWALESLMETLAAEVAQFGIRVVLIEPGAILTPIITKGNPTDPTSPYATIYRRFMKLSMNDFGQGSTPDVVADCIAESITCEPAKLRWLTGQGAERNIRVRTSMTDEESIGTWTLEDDDVFMKTLVPELGET